MTSKDQTLMEHMAENRRERNRCRVANLILYFKEKVQHCNTIKLYKLLCLLDFEHYRQTGRSVTGLEYVARGKGPVPRELQSNMKDAAKFRSAYPEVRMRVTKSNGQVKRREFKSAPNHQLNLEEFSPRMIMIMEKLATTYCNHTANEMIDVTHQRQQPWTLVYADGAGSGKVISYKRALRKKQPRVIAKFETMSRAAVKDLEEIYGGFR